MSTLGSGPVEVSKSPHVRWHTLPLNAVALDGGVLGERQAANRKIGLKHGYEQLKIAGAFHSMALAGGGKTVEKDGPFTGPSHIDCDLFKWLEAVVYEQICKPEPIYARWIEETVSLIEKAQAPDGYLNSYFQATAPERKWADTAMGHELYCMGHFLQAAIAHERLTGKGREDTLIKVAYKLVAHIAEVFGPNHGQKKTCCGHPEIESALLELYRTTREESHFKLAEFFINIRGQSTVPMNHWIFGGPAYAQDATPVRQADEMVGHAVRQLYYLAGVADLYMETGEQALLTAMERLWKDMTHRKMYLHGGIGSRQIIETFGDSYELPQAKCYCETCAAIASLFWNFRLMLITGDARYMDLFENTFYNAVLSGYSLDGAHYFYVNPMACDNRTTERFSWHPCACCPPNVMRLLSSIQNYMITGDENSTQIHLYDTAIVYHAGLKLHMQTRYPYESGVKITVESAPGKEHALSLRVPAWCKNAQIRVNGKEAPVAAGYTTIAQIFKTGDVIELNFPLQPVWMESHPFVESTQNCIALYRGPLMYCAEQQDQPDDVDIRAMEVKPADKVKETWKSDLLGGTLQLEINAFRKDLNAWENHLYRPYVLAEEKSAVIRMIPYYLWANRAANIMRVWFPKKDQ